MGLLDILRRKKKKEEEKEKRMHVGIDWRMSPEEYFKLMFYGTLLLYTVAWSSFIISSLLYLMAIGGLLLFIIYFAGEKEKKNRLFFPFLAGLFFLIFSFSPKFGGYVMGAYLSSFFINIVGYLLLRPIFREENEKQRREAVAND